ncbi:hypothetical protein Strvi_0008 (plasmid) [Streptomyces violaceusniger Tu 4113]|uniref:Uncharacterized protein n=1 Tax=Streptomyces violaceusniger (strain Tu 4113) TaxID=653045 RepID=G2PHD9_STRV4|nr:hypothetical protein Strvi_0008 [Streptomyces violaceusniger Tu 4113]
MTTEGCHDKRGHAALAQSLPFLASIIHEHYVEKRCEDMKIHASHDHGDSTKNEFFRCPGLTSGGKWWPSRT